MGVVRGNTVCQKSSSSFYDESLDSNQINLERGLYRNLNLPISSRNSSRRSSGYDNESNMNLMSPISLTSPYSLNNNNVISIKYIFTKIWTSAGSRYFIFIDILVTIYRR